MEKTRTRFAPSPTGYMHIGNLRTAIFEYLIAKHDNGDFVLRIEDTDQTRKVEGAVDFIYDTLSLCGFKIDEGPKNQGEYGPYVQSERIDIYKKYALELVENGAAYYCFCREERSDGAGRLSVFPLRERCLADKGCSAAISRTSVKDFLGNLRGSLLT